MRYTIAIIALFLSVLSYAQNGKMAFGNYADMMDSIMVADYKAKDAASFVKHLAEFEAVYRKQDATTRKNYKGNLEGDYYNLACTYALAGDKKNAIASLVKSEYSEYDHMLEDSDMDPLRNEPGFKQYLQKIKDKKSDKLITLQQDAGYNQNEKRELPKFTYQSPDDPNLKELRKAYDLDSIAGNASEIIRIINLMHWVHNSIKHNGSGGLPNKRTATNIFTTCAGPDKKGCNCRGLAITLNEVYLAAGFKSRFITCLPKDTADNDCHVITMVYSNTLGKWLWMDPTFDAYVMNENGDLLGPGEVRERLVSNKPLVLNPEANWNHKNSTTKRYYLGYYMAKNLYRIECAVHSEYNSDTYAEGKVRDYVQLKPVCYMPQKTIDKNSSATYIVYMTNDPARFWAKPE